MSEQLPLFSDIPIPKTPRRIYPTNLAERFKPRTGKPYRPANGSEGMLFDDLWCCQCVRYDDCVIPGLTMLWDIDEPNYPPEWQYDSQGQPCCTAFQERNDNERIS